MHGFHEKQVFALFLSYVIMKIADVINPWVNKVICMYVAWATCAGTSPWPPQFWLTADISQSCWLMINRFEQCLLNVYLEGIDGVVDLRRSKLLMIRGLKFTSKDFHKKNDSQWKKDPLVSRRSYWLGRLVV